MAEIRWTKEAEIWLKDIHDFIAEDSKQTAEKVIDGIYQRAQLLKHHPESDILIALKRKERSGFYYMVIIALPTF